MLHMLYNKAALKNFQNSQENIYTTRVFFDKVAGFFIRKGPRHRRCPLSFAKFIELTILKNTVGQLFLKVH